MTIQVSRILNKLFHRAKDSHQFLHKLRKHQEHL